MISFRERIPQHKDILYVYGGVVFGIYTWSIRGFLYQVSSLRLYHPLGEILAIFAYLMAFALIESIIVMAALLIIGLTLPRSWFREGFAYKGFIVTLVAAIAMIALHSYLFSLNYALPSMTVISLSLAVTTVLLVALIWVFQNRPKLQKLIIALQERLQAFLYFYIPLGIMGMIVVILRNLF